LFGKKSTNVINIITGISVLGITIGTAALLLILTVFNGLEELISGFFNSFNPPIKISLVEGKTFSEEDIAVSDLMKMEGVSSVSKSLEDLVLYEYDGIQEIGYMKGVDEYFNQVNAIDSVIRKGTFKLEDEKSDLAVFGVGLANKLNLSVQRNLYPVRVFAPAKQSGLMSASPYKSQFIYTAGTFSVQDEQDNKYAFCSLPFLQSLLSKRGRISALEIGVTEGADMKKLKREIKELVGDGFYVKDQYEQDASFLRLMQIEKWLSYALACFTLLLIAFNMVGALWMIVIEKKKDMSILKSLGMTKSRIEKIFIAEGILICFIGFILGAILSIIIYQLQIHIGLVPIPPGSIIDTYPVLMKAGDFFIVFITVMTIGCLASLLPAKRAGRIPAFLRD
jgi:lipoprotein-releasing system permease protein